MRVDHRGHARPPKHDNMWGDRSKNKTIDIHCEVTIDDPEDGAVHVHVGLRGVWLPRSLITINDDGTVTVPMWLAIARKLA